MASYAIGDEVTFEVIEEDLQDRPTGVRYWETGYIERMDRDEHGCLIIQVRVSQSRFYLLNAEILG